MLSDRKARTRPGRVSTRAAVCALAMAGSFSTAALAQSARFEGAPLNPGLSISPSQIPFSQRLRPTPTRPALQSLPSQVPTTQRLGEPEQVPRSSYLLRQGTLDERALTVYEQPRPDYDPVGVDLPLFVLFPAVDTAYEYNENVFASPDKRVDHIFNIGPRLSLKSKFEQDQLNFDIASLSGFYANNEDERFTDYQGGANGRYYLTPTLVLFGRAGAAHLHENRGSPDDTRGTEPTGYNDYTAYGGIGQTGLELQWQADAYFERLKFNDTEATGGDISNRFRDRDSVVTTARVGYELTRQFSPFVRGTYNDRNYFARTAGFKKDSHGYSAVIGTNLDLQSVFVAEVFAGVMRQDYSDGSFSDITTPTFGVDAVWNVMPQASLLFNALRTIDETSLAGASGIVSTNVSVGAQYQIYENLLARADYGHSFVDFRSTSFNDDIDVVTASVSYYLGRNIAVTPLVSYTNRSTDRPGRDFDQVRAIVGVTFAY